LIFVGAPGDLQGIYGAARRRERGCGGAAGPT